MKDKKFKFGDKVRFWEVDEWINAIYVDYDRSLREHDSSHILISLDNTFDDSIDRWYVDLKDIKRGWKK